MAELTAVVEGAGGRRGVVSARAALPLLNGRARSPMESRTRAVLVLGGCPPPEVNVPIYDADGDWLAEGDLVWRKAKLLGEYDGEVHLAEKQRRVDAQRHNQLVAEGWTVLHITADDVLRHPYALIALVKSQLTRPQPDRRPLRAANGIERGNRNASDRPVRHHSPGHSRARRARLSTLPTGNNGRASTTVSCLGTL